MLRRIPSPSSSIFLIALCALGLFVFLRAWSAGSLAQESDCHGRRDNAVMSVTAQFPGAGEDLAPSLGKFRLVIEPRFRSMMDGMPGYDAATGNLDSPVMFDHLTTIMRSAPLVNGSAEDEAGVAVGFGNVTVSDRDFKVLPDPASFPDAPGTREIHTAIKRFSLTGLVGGLPVVHVRAGTDFEGLPLSAGEVRSHDLGGAPADDMPAHSFFNIYVEVDLPPNPMQPLTFPGATLHNADPLLVQNDTVDRLPPRVVYLHDGPSAVAVMFNEEGDHWAKDDVLGHLTLAGHGVCFNNNPAEVAELEAALERDDGIPTATLVPTTTPTTTPSATASPSPQPTPSPTASATQVPLPAYLPIAVSESCESGVHYIDVALVLDTSSSMTGSAIEAARDGAAAFLTAMRLNHGDQVALVTFHGQARLALELSDSRKRLEAAIDTIDVTGTGTAIDAALRLATDELTSGRARSSNQPLLVLMTDGRQSGGPATALAAGEAAREAGILVYTIGLGADADATTLRTIAGSDERHLASPTSGELRSVFRALGKSLICSGQRLWPARP